MLTYEGSILISIDYTDLDFMLDIDSRKSTSRYVFTLGGAAVNQRSINQQCIVDSITEVEYVAAIEAAKVVVQLKKLLLDLIMVPQTQLPIILYCDNNGAIAQSKDLRNHKCGKHIEWKYHLIREIVQSGDVTVTKVASADNLAVPFTKA